MALGATVVGMLVFWTIPAAAGDFLPILLPVAFYENQTPLITFGCLFCNAMTTLFLR